MFDLLIVLIIIVLLFSLSGQGKWFKAVIEGAVSLSGGLITAQNSSEVACAALYHCLRKTAALGVPLGPSPSVAIIEGK